LPNDKNMTNGIDRHWSQDSTPREWQEEFGQGSEEKNISEDREGLRLSQEQIKKLHDLADAIGKFLNGMDQSVQNITDTFFSYWPKDEKLKEEGGWDKYEKLNDLCDFIKERLRLITEARVELYECRESSSTIEAGNALITIEHNFSAEKENIWNAFISDVRQQYNRLSTPSESISPDSDTEKALKKTLEKLEEFILMIRNKSEGEIKAILEQAQSGLSKQ